MQLLTESNGYWPVLRELALEGKIQGSIMHDARIAALCRQHGIQELWTAGIFRCLGCVYRHSLKDFFAPAKKGRG
ncbi:MAG: hypothetical protein MRJ96_08445 [Nitrospirales bacterium]|nr:hypothetical protein [Nitrospirales bacterium]